MPRTVAQYTALLDVPALSWKLQLGRSGGGKCLLITFMKEVLKLHQASVQQHYVLLHAEVT